VVTKCRQYEALLTEEESKARSTTSNESKRTSATKPSGYNARLNGNCYGKKTIAECLMEKVKFGNDLRVDRVERVRMVDGSKRPLDFTYSIVTEACNYLLVGNSKHYCIAICNEFFGVER
jgi:hypothetical protein